MNGRRYTIWASIGLSIAFILVAGLVVAYFYDGTPRSGPGEALRWEYEGTLSFQEDGRGAFWGLLIDFWDRPLGPRKLRISNLPEEFRTDQLRVRIKYGVTDVIGTSDWDVIIFITEIHRI